MPEVLGVRLFKESTSGQDALLSGCFKYKCCFLLSLLFAYFVDESYDTLHNQLIGSARMQGMHADFFSSEPVKSCIYILA